ncbi:hypothetical protein [Sorangium sp. So ce1389]|uniref:hypothetical protein n=1 Tax=Sorangium sp. So ce1389 TaxID=3133336 RepID=UPI003F62EDCB
MRHLIASAAVWGSVLLSACSGEGVAAWDDSLDAASALSTGAAAALGFESLSGWTASAGSLSLSATRSEGEHALAVAGAGYTVIQRAPLAINEPIKGAVSLDVRVPDQQPNPWWAGEISLAVQAPSEGVSQSLGTRSLTGLAQGTFHRLSFTVPPAVQQALSAGAPDVSFTITLNVPSGSGPHLLDRLDAFDAGPPVAAAPLPPWLEYCDAAPCATAAPVVVYVCPASNPLCTPVRKTTVVPNVDGTPISGVFLPLTLPEGATLRLASGSATVNSSFVTYSYAPRLVLHSDLDVLLSYYDVAPVWNGTTPLTFESTLTSSAVMDSAFFRHPSYNTGTAAADLHAQGLDAVSIEREMTDITSEKLHAFFVPSELGGVLGEGNFSYGNGTITINYGNPLFIAHKGGIPNAAMPRFAHENAHELYDEITSSISGDDSCLNEGIADALAFLTEYLPVEDFGPLGLTGIDFDTGCTELTRTHDIGNCYFWHVKNAGLLTESFMHGIFHPQHQYDFNSCTQNVERTGNSILVYFTEAAGGANMVPVLDAMEIPHAGSYAAAKLALGL